LQSLLTNLLMLRLPLLPSLSWLSTRCWCDGQKVVIDMVDVVPKKAASVAEMSTN